MCSFLKVFLEPDLSHTCGLSVSSSPVLTSSSGISVERDIFYTWFAGLSRIS